MRILSFSLKIMLLLLLPAFYFSSCKDDEPKPDTATIHGTVTIDNAELWASWQDSGVVELTIFPAFSLNPPAGWGPVPAGTFGPNDPGGTYALGAPYNSQDPLIITYTPGITGFEYSLTVDPGEYSALALGFRHNRISDPSLKTATLGVHWNTPDSTSHGIVILPYFNYPAPSVITVEKGDNVEINFRSDFAFVNAWFH